MGKHPRHPAQRHNIEMVFYLAARRYMTRWLTNAATAWYSRLMMLDSAGVWLFSHQPEPMRTPVLAVGFKGQSDACLR